MALENKIIRPIAIYLPQFHPIPENDEWWGKGFTEWRNVVKARPLFKGHSQPHLPADLGFYDLRVEEARIAQAELARASGVHGFCYYHYWFNGRRVLERPFQEVLKSQKPDFPFMLCWANENWTRKWDGHHEHVLLKQDYGPEDDANHINHLLEAFEDRRYIRVNNKPVFIVYKVNEMPDPTRTAALWRRIAATRGIELYLCHMVFGYNQNQTLIEGFDAAVDFEPFGVKRGNIFETINNGRRERRKTLFSRGRSMIQRLGQGVDPRDTYDLVEYEELYRTLKSTRSFDYKLYPSATPGWDNSPRKGARADLILRNSTPEKFAAWLKAIKDDFVPFSAEENFVYVNAWNEWAEGNHLEPCAQFGSGYLNALKTVLGA